MKIEYLFFVMVSLSITISSGDASDTKPRVFTNADLEKHRTSPDPEVAGGQTKQGNKTLKMRGPEHLNREMWCRRGELCRSRIERARKELELAEIKYTESLSGRRGARKSRKREETPEARMKKVRQKLERAEQDLNDLEQNAHRKNVPPGWLRCQFGY